MSSFYICELLDESYEKKKGENNISYKNPQYLLIHFIGINYRIFKLSITLEMINSNTIRYSFRH